MTQKASSANPNSELPYILALDVGTSSTRRPASPRRSSPSTSGASVVYGCASTGSAFAFAAYMPLVASRNGLRRAILIERRSEKLLVMRAGNLDGAELPQVLGDDLLDQRVLDPERPDLDHQAVREVEGADAGGIEGADGVERLLDVLGGGARDLAQRPAGQRRQVREVLAAHRRHPLATDEIVVSRPNDDALLELLECLMDHGRPPLSFVARTRLGSPARSGRDWLLPTFASAPSTVNSTLVGCGTTDVVSPGHSVQSKINR